MRKVKVQFFNTLLKWEVLIHVFSCALGWIMQRKWRVLDCKKSMRHFLFGVGEEV